MKVMAIGTLAALTPEQQQQYMPKEVPATLQIYLDGKMDQFWLRDQMAGPIFLMNTSTVDEAKLLLGALPLVRAKLLTFDFLPVGPLLPLGIFLQH